MSILMIHEPRREKTGIRDFRPATTQTGMYSHRRRLEAGNFGYKRNCTTLVPKANALISLAVTVTAQLICAFVFA